MLEGAPDLSRPLYGHAKAEAQCAQAIHQKALPCAYMFTGTQGIGKANMAWRVAAQLLSHDDGKDHDDMGLFGDPLPQAAPTTLSYDAQHPSIIRMLHGSHPDFLWLRPAYDDKKKQFKDHITIEQTRKIGQFLSLTAGEGAWKIVIVDTADAMNNAAANALLKWLEEPPERSLFILISHTPGQLLPTIRSRCRVLGFSTPDYESFCNALAQETSEEMQQLYCLVGGSAGIAKAWQHASWQTYWHALLSLCSSHESSTSDMQQLSTRFSKDTQFGLDEFGRMTDSLLGRAAKAQATGHVEAYSVEEERAITMLCKKKNALQWIDIIEKNTQSRSAAKGLYLDKQHVIFSLLDVITR